jgi:tetratricopeptide (TPR) repeat protein
MDAPAGTVYAGNLVEVLDRAALDREWAVIGIDPAILPSLVRMTVQIDSDDMTSEGLGTRIELLGLELIAMPDGRRFVCRRGTRDMHLALQAAAENKTGDAAELAREALRKDPDNTAFLFLFSLANRLDTGLRELKRETSILEEAVETQAGQDTKAAAPVGQNAIYRFAGEWERFMGTVWEAYRNCCDAGIGDAMGPFLSIVRNEMTPLLGALETLRHRVKPLDLQAEFERKQAVARALDDLLTHVRARREKARTQTEKALALAADGNPRSALAMLTEAYEFSPTAFETRTALAWCHAALRREALARKRDAAKQSYAHPDSASLASAARSVVSDLIKAEDWQTMVVFAELARHHDIDVSCEPDALERPRSPVGRVAGLATLEQGMVGSVFPFTVTMGPRTDLRTYHELVINEGSGASDALVRDSLTNALYWLDVGAGGCLKNYRVVLHFRDLSSAKGGPSFGLALAVAAYSALYDLPVDRTIALTGTVGPDGYVGAVGGIAAKLRAAAETGVRLILMPAENRADLFTLEPEVLERLKIVTVSSVDEALPWVFPRARGAVGVQRANLFRRAADVYLRLGLLPEARAAFAACAELAPDDVTSELALAELAMRQLPDAELPRWLTERASRIGREEAPSVDMAETRAQAARQCVERAAYLLNVHGREGQP